MKQSDKGVKAKRVQYRRRRTETKAWVALGKSFRLCRLKNRKNAKPQPERKTFSQTEQGRTST